eukprot:746584-Hanusia_phi.AAC.3
MARSERLSSRVPPLSQSSGSPTRTSSSGTVSPDSSPWPTRAPTPTDPSSSLRLFPARGAGRGVDEGREADRVSADGQQVGLLAIGLTSISGHARSPQGPSQDRQGRCLVNYTSLNSATHSVRTSSTSLRLKTVVLAPCHASLKDIVASSPAPVTNEAPSIRSPQA